MLTNDAVIAVTPLVTILENNNMAVVPYPGSILNTLVSVSSSVSPDDTDIAKSITDATNRKDELLNVNQHDLYMDDAVQVIGKAVRNHISFARNTVSPVISDLVDKVSAEIQNSTTSSLLGLEVFVQRLPLPLTDPAIDALIGQFENAPYDDPAVTLNLPSISAAEIREYVKTGNSSIDDSVRVWLGEKGDLFVTRIWESLFTQNSQERLKYRDFVTNRPADADNALLVFILSRYLFNNPPHGVEMELTKYNAIIAEYRNQAATTLSYILKDVRRSISMKRLVTLVNGNVVSVFGPVYNEWIMSGGSNEVLFGLLVSNKPYITVTDIDANKEELLGIWKRHSMLTSTNDAIAKFITTKEVMRRHFINQLQSLSDEEKIATGNSIPALTARFDAVLADAKSTESVWDLALRAVCRGRFYYSNAEDILAGIEEVKKLNPSVSVREAAGMSVFRYISRWVASQLVLKDNNY